MTAWDAEVSEVDKFILCDAQTSGGLLIAVPAERADALIDALRTAPTLAAAIIGDIRAGEPHIDVIP